MATASSASSASPTKLSMAAGWPAGSSACGGGNAWGTPVRSNDEPVFVVATKVGRTRRRKPVGLCRKRSARQLETDGSNPDQISDTLAPPLDTPLERWERLLTQSRRKRRNPAILIAREVVRSRIHVATRTGSAPSPHLTRPPNRAATLTRAGADSSGYLFGKAKVKRVRQRVVS